MSHNLLPLPRSFYSRSTLEVAPDLLGKILCFNKNKTFLSGKIVEVEAYLGTDDPASHAYPGLTQRNQAMFGPPGHAYVYFTYGMYFCFNVVTELKGKSGAVLIRALEPFRGTSLMQRRRRKKSLFDLTSGPGKLTQAFGISKKENSVDLTKKPLWIAEDPSVSTIIWKTTPRIGIRQAKHFLYRFVIVDSPFLSRKS